MRRIIGGMFISLDGVIQAPGGPTEDSTGGFVHGTYDIFAAYWPYVDGEGTTMGEKFTAANKYVLTRREQPFPWANSHRLRGMDDVAKLKLVDYKVSPGGTALATYEPAASVETGSVGAIESAREEEERQRNIQDGTW